MGQRAFLLKMK